MAKDAAACRSLWGCRARPAGRKTGARSGPPDRVPGRTTSSGPPTGARARRTPPPKTVGWAPTGTHVGSAFAKNGDTWSCASEWLGPGGRMRGRPVPSVTTTPGPPAPYDTGYDTGWLRATLDLLPPGRTS